MKDFFKNCLVDVTLYPVTCEDLSAGRSDIEVLKEVMAAGAKIIQLRDKKAEKKIFLEKAKIFRKITKQFGAILMINDHLDIALEIKADGVHLGQDDLSLNVVREKLLALPYSLENEHLKKKFIIGISCHNLTQALQAEKEGASYINIGPIFTTQTKKKKQNKSTPGIGIEIIPKIKSHLNIPFTVMGGIKEKHIPLLLKNGAQHIAMITEITQHPNIQKHTRHLLDLFKRYARINF